MAKLASTRVYGNLVVDNALNIAGQLTSAVAIGTAPLVVASTTKVTNLNADLLDDLSSASFARLDSASTFTTIPAFNGGTTGASAPFTVDSTFLVSNLNADLLDGNEASAFATAGHNHDTAYSALSHTHYKLDYDDGPRDLTNRLPTWSTRAVTFDFVNAGIVGGTGNYGGVMTYIPWTGTTSGTGDSSYQLAFANLTGVNASGIPALKIRNGIDSTWNAWHTFYHTGNKPTASDVGAATSTQGATADTAIQSGSFAGTAFTKTGTALSITQTAARTALGLAGGAYVEAYTHPTPTRTDTASTAAPAFGGTFTAVDSVTSNTDGHVTAINLKTVTIPTPSTVNDGTLSWTTSTAGATNTTIAGSLSGAYSANTANNRTLSLAIGPAITSLATVMTGAATGLLKKTGADTYGLDANLYAGSASAGGAATNVNMTMAEDPAEGYVTPYYLVTVPAATGSQAQYTHSQAGRGVYIKVDNSSGLPDTFLYAHWFFGSYQGVANMLSDSTAVTQPTNTNSAQLATTAYVDTNTILRTYNQNTVTSATSSGTDTDTIVSLTLAANTYYKVSFIGRAYCSSSAATTQIVFTLSNTTGTPVVFGTIASALQSATSITSDPIYYSGVTAIGTAVLSNASTSSAPTIINYDVIIYTGTSSKTLTASTQATFAGTVISCNALPGCSLTAIKMN